MGGRPPGSEGSHAGSPVTWRGFAKAGRAEPGCPLGFMRPRHLLHFPLGGKDRRRPAVHCFRGRGRSPGRALHQARVVFQPETDVRSDLPASVDGFFGRLPAERGNCRFLRRLRGRSSGQWLDVGRQCGKGTPGRGSAAQARLRGPGAASSLVREGSSSRSVLGFVRRLGDHPLHSLARNTVEI